MLRVSYIKSCGLPYKNKAKLPQIPTKINKKIIITAQLHQ